VPECGDEHERERKRGHGGKPTTPRDRSLDASGLQLGTVGREPQGDVAIRSGASKTRLAVAGGILLLAVVTAAAGYAASALVIVACWLLRVIAGRVMDRRAGAQPPQAVSDPLGDDVRTFARTLRDDVVGADDFLAAAETTERPGRPGP
jgi:hypothetical protein